MTARLARTAFASAARRGFLAGSSSTSRMSWRRKASTSSHEPTKSSDTPWIIGSLLIFGPAFLYLVSPSARKSHHSEHKDKHDFPVLLQDDHAKVLKGAHVPEPATDVEKPEPELMKDDEGAVADVASSITLAESSDVPNDAQSPENLAAFKSAAESDSSKVEEKTSSLDPEAADDSASSGENTKGPQTPTFTDEANTAAVEHVTPKEGSERRA